MARPRRVQVAGGVYHVTARGVRGEPMFLHDVDRMVWIATLAETCDRAGWEVHAYVQLGNHYHLVVETPKPNISAGMQYLGGTYATRFNHANGYVGHLQYRRFHAKLIDSEDYALEVARYVALNPVRAGLCTHPEEWPWSSYGAILGIRPSHPFLHIDRTLSLFRSDRNEARQAMRTFVEAGMGPSLPPIPKLSTLLANVTPDNIRLAQREYGYTIAQIAAHLRVSVATVHRWAR